ncbi:MAG: CDP-alcohol phosphatidyltransferase family protein [Synergistaceae bacterium]|nr:CDP-alcohol phosphatidyltransferase family protein [Synergistaceae bacterium]
MANLITTVRILCSLSILFCKVSSPAFYTLYLICGISDILDGAIARKSHTASEFGAKFDTFADVVFAVFCMVKILPVLELPSYVWVAVVIVALIKISNIIVHFCNYHELAAVHTRLNKLSGFLLFVFPFTVNLIDVKYSSGVLCTLTLIAAVQEGRYIRI